MPYYRAVPDTLFSPPSWGGLGIDTTKVNAIGPTLVSGLTAQQKQACGAAQAWLAQHPVVNSVLTSPGCGVCPTCPAPEECPTPEQQGYIDPAMCPTVDCAACPTCEAQGYVAKTESGGGIAWWWLLIAAAGGSALGYALGAKKKAVGI